MLAPSRVAEGGRVEGVEPDTTVRGRLVEVLFPALTDRLPMSVLDLLPPNLGGGISLNDRTSYRHV
jgi:hypothetical protein